MDDRQAQLIGAAEALRVWVHAQRAAWTDGSAMSFPDRHTPVFEQGTAVLADPPPLFDGYASAAAFDVPTRSASPVRPTIDVVARLGAGLRRLVHIGSRGAAVAGRFWQVGVASAVVIGTLWAATAYWPVWSRALKAQLAMAGQHSTVFDRPAPPAVAAEPKAPERPTARRTGRVQIDSNPPGAAVVVDGKERGVTPLTLGDLSVGAHTVLLRGADGSVQRTVTVSADKTTQLNEAIYSGWLHVSSPIELEIVEGTHALHLDDSNQVLLPPGPHELRFENRRFGFVDIQKIDVRPGDTTSVSVQPPASKLTVTASTPAEVLVDGTLVGGTPLTNHALNLGTREVTVRNAAGAERRAMITVTVEPVRLDVDFATP